MPPPLCIFHTRALMRNCYSWCNFTRKPCEKLTQFPTARSLVSEIWSCAHLLPRLPQCNDALRWGHTLIIHRIQHFSLFIFSPAGGDHLRKIVQKIKEREKKCEKQQGRLVGERERLRWTDNAFGVSYNCRLTVCRPLGFSVCNIWPLE